MWLACVLWLKLSRWGSFGNMSEHPWLEKLWTRRVHEQAVNTRVQLGGKAYKVEFGGLVELLFGGMT